jgi:hypothetical protein
MSLFYALGSYSYIVVGLVIFCGIHSYRRGTLGRWILWLIFLPGLGSLYYLFTEVFNNKKSFVKPTNFAPKPAVSGASIRKLEEELRFTDTFANRGKLADAYLATGQTDKAIELYTSSLTGAFSENEHVMQQLIVAYYQQEDYEQVIPLAKKLYKLPQFARSRWHLLYAQALENLGQTEQAENEFKAMKGRYSYFEQRYQYGLFLMRAGRDDEAWQIFTDILNEEQHLSPMERKTNRAWFSKTKDELRKISPAQKTG